MTGHSKIFFKEITCDSPDSSQSTAAAKVIRPIWSVTVSRESSGDYYASLLYEYESCENQAEHIDAVAIEDIDMKAMSRCLNFGKSVMDNGYGMFCTMLKYKLEQQNKKLIVIDRFYPSSKKCSCCGNIKPNLLLSDRVYECECGNRMNRDYNAALNIRDEGKRIIACA